VAGLDRPVGIRHPSIGIEVIAVALAGVRVTEPKLCPSHFLHLPSLDFKEF